MKKNIAIKPYIFPQPVLIIGTYDEDGNPNAMNAAWGGVCDYDKVFVVLSEHKTTSNLLKSKAFSISVANVKNVVACDYVGVVSANDEPKKFEKAGWTASMGQVVNAPIINELPLTLECEVVSYDEESQILIGKIVNVQADEEVIGKDGEPDVSKIMPILFDGMASYYAYGEKVGNAFSDGFKLNK